MLSPHFEHATPKVSTAPGRAEIDLLGFQLALRRPKDIPPCKCLRLLTALGPVAAAPLYLAPIVKKSPKVMYGRSSQKGSNIT